MPLTTTHALVVRMRIALQMDTVLLYCNELNKKMKKKLFIYFI
jgi:hypothetical protein